MQINEGVYHQYQPQCSNVKSFRTTNTLLLQSIIWFGLSFILVFGIGIGFVKLFESTTLASDSTTFYIILVISLLVCLITTMILKFKWSFDILNASTPLVVFSYILNIAIYGFMFGNIFYALEIYDIDPTWMLIMFGIVGLVTIISGLIAYGLSRNAAISLMKISTILASILLIATLTFSLVGFFVFIKSKVPYLIFDIAFCVLMIIFLILNFNAIINHSKQLQACEVSNRQLIVGGLFYGIEILSYVMIILYYLLRIFIRIKE